MPRVPEYQLQQSLGAPGSAQGVGQTMLHTVKAAAGFTGDLLEAGETVLKTFERQQAIENQKTVLDARLGMQNSIADLETQLQTIDPAEWIDRFDEHAQTYKQEFLARNYPPETRQKLELEANATFGKARIQIATAGLQQNTQNTRQKYGQDIQHLAERGDMETARARLHEMKSLGLIDDPDYQNQSRQLDAMEAAQGFQRLIDENPYKADELINAPNFLEANPSLTLEDQRGLARQAERTIHLDKADFWEAAVDAANNPTNPKILSAEELHTLAESGKISQTDRAKYLDAYHSQGTILPDPAIYGAAIDAIRSYNPQDDPDGFQLAQLRAGIATLKLPKEHVSELGKRLTARANGEGSTTASGKIIPPALRPIEDHYQDLQKKYFDAGFFGGWSNYEDHDDNPNTVDREVIDLPDYNRAAAQALEFQKTWENYLSQAPEDLTPTKAAEEYERLFQDFKTKGPSPFENPDLPPPADLDQDVKKILDGAGDNRGTRLQEVPSGPVYRIEQASFKKRQAVARAGGTPILLDTNYSSAPGGVASPLVVIPDNATPAQRQAAQSYADSIASVLNKKLGRTLKGTVKTRSENGRGLTFAVHTEPYALTDPAAVRFMTSPEGMDTHRKILRSTLGKLPKANFFLPHKPGDPGATVGGRSEVSTALELLRGFDSNLPAGAMTEPRQQAQSLWWQSAQPTSPNEIRAGLDELDTLRALHQIQPA